MKIRRPREFTFSIGALATLLVLLAPVSAAQIFVASNGRDIDGGTRAKPVATLERAQKLARAAIVRGESVDVVLRAGTYELSAPLALGKDDSGSAQKPAVWRAESGEIVRLSGGKTLTRWQKVSDPAVRARLGANVRDKVLEFDLKAAGITNLSKLTGGFISGRSPGLELFLDDVPMHVSRYPNRGFIKISELLGATPVDVRGTIGRKEGIFRVEDKRVARWTQEPDARVLGYWFWDWAYERQNIASIDPATLTITLAEPHHESGYLKGQYFYGFNLLSEIDEPGEWFLDNQRGMAYVLPPKTPKRVMISRLPSILQMKDATNITFRNIIFEGTSEDIVTIYNSQNCSIVASTFRNSNEWGVIIAGGNNCSVRGSDFYSLGAGGVYAEGGDRKTLTPGNHVVENCHMHHYSRWRRTYNPGIKLVGVGNKALRNLIDHAPHEAMEFIGNDHLLEGNEIHNVCEETKDAGAIYAGRDWAARGNIIRGNYLHHIYGLDGLGANGVYLDDNFSSATIENNIFTTQVRPLHLGGGRDHKVLNNLFVDCFSTLHIDARGLGWRAYGFDELKTNLEQFPYTTPPWSIRYPELLTLLTDEPMAPKNILVARNILVNSLNDDIEDKARPYVTFKDNLFDAPRSLLEISQKNLKPRLKDDAALKKIGFLPINLARIGIYKSTERASWPVTHIINVRAWPKKAN